MSWRAKQADQGRRLLEDVVESLPLLHLALRGRQQIGLQGFGPLGAQRERVHARDHLGVKPWEVVRLIESGRLDQCAACAPIQ